MPINAKYAAPAMRHKDAMNSLNDLTKRADKVLKGQDDDAVHKDWLQALHYALHKLSTFDDFTLANVYLLCGGAILSSLSLVCLVAGMAYIFKGDIASSKALVPYFVGSTAFAILAFFAVWVKKRKGRRKG